MEREQEINLHDFDTGVIREIRIYGRMQNAFSIKVGQVFDVKGKSIRITEIIRDKNFAMLYQQIRYLVRAKDEDTDNSEFDFKDFINVSIEITYDINL